MPCIMPNTPLLAVEITINPNDSKASFQKITRHMRPLYPDYPKFFSSAKLRNVTVNTRTGDIHLLGNWEKCLDIAFEVNPGTAYTSRYEFDHAYPIDYFHEDDGSVVNPIRNRPCAEHHEPRGIEQIQVEPPLIGRSGGRNVIVSFTYQNHRMLNIGTAKPISSNIGYYRLRLNLFPRSGGNITMKCTDPQVPNGDHSNPKLVETYGQQEAQMLVEGAVTN